ncbi:MAG: MFS transporter [Chloroflexota bacterium]
MPPAAPVRLRFQLLAFSLVRTVLNTGYRMVYPFLPVIARGLGVDLSAMALAVTARSSLGLASPFLGSTADVRGRKAVMLTSLLLFAAAMAFVPLTPTYSALFASLLIAGAAKIAFDPAMQAYLGDRVQYAQRGLAIALTEFGWSGAFLLGVPLAGWAMARAGWAGPFPWLAALALASALVLWRVLPRDPAQPSTPSWASGFLSVLSSRSAVAGLAVGVLISAANEMVNIVFGAWLEASFGLQVVALGAASAIIGASELTGEGLVALVADRLGKRRAVALGVMLNGLAGLALALLGRSLAGALLGLFALYLSFEFTLVSAIPLMTELVPAARATLMAANVGAHSAGRALGALLGPVLFGGGLFSVVAAAGALDLAALAALLLFVRE